MDLTRIIERIKPTNKEKEDVERAIAKISKKLNVRNSKIHVGGSFGKGTWITGMHDIDLFVCFDYEKHCNSSYKLPDLLQQHLKNKKIKHKRIHGSRDYFETKIGKYSFELIPILEIKKAEQSKNLTDASPLHTFWVKKHAKGNLADQIRLLKAFCISQGCYGGESYIRGFSGYVCEILAIHFKTFQNTLKAAGKWKFDEKTVIDPERHYKSKNEALRQLNTAKIQSPLVVIDPIQADRNAAAALSTETFNKFIDSATKFISKPSEEFFTEKRKTPQELKSKDNTNKTIVIEAIPLEGKPDIALSKILKMSEHIKQRMASSGFQIFDSGIEWTKTPLIWIRTQKTIPEKFIIKGPPEISKEHMQRFRQTHGKVFIKKGLAFAEEKRKHTDPASLMKTILKDNYVKERSKKVLLHD